MAASAPRAGRPGGPGRTGAVLFVALTASNVGNLAFHVLASRLLGAADYGALGSLLALLLVISIPAGALHVALTSEVVRLHEHGERPALAGAMRAVGGRATVLAGGLALTSPLLSQFLHLQSPVPALLVAAYVVPAGLAIVPRAVLHGQGRQGAVAMGAITTTVVRLAVAAAVIRLGGGVSGAIAASVASEFVHVAVLLIAAGRAPAGSQRLRVPWGASVEATIAFTGLWALLAADTVLARHHLDARTAGGYVAAATVARAALFLPQSIALVALPAMASSDPARASRSLRAALWLIVGLGVCSAAAMTAIGAPVLAAVFGPGIEVPRQLLGLLATASAAAGVVHLLTSYHLLARHPGARAPWLGLAAVVFPALVWRPGPLALAALAFGAGALVALVSLWALRSPTPRRLPVRPSLGRLDRDSSIDLTVVVPFYNPGGGLRSNVLGLVDALDQSGVSYELIAVADGCTDGSPATLADLTARSVRCIELPRNGGKGAALRVGLREGRGRYLGFIDADGDLEPALWLPFLELMRMHRPDVVVGSKRHPQSVVEAGVVRRTYSWGYRHLVRSLFRLPLGDTQVGIKLFRREVLCDVLPHTVECGFVFDVEVLALARRMGYRRFLEAPVVLRRNGDSTISHRTAARMFTDTVGLAWRLRVLRIYDDATPAPVVVLEPAVATPAPTSVLEPVG